MLQPPKKLEAAVLLLWHVLKSPWELTILMPGYHPQHFWVLGDSDVQLKLKRTG